MGWATGPLGGVSPVYSSIYVFWVVCLREAWREDFFICLDEKKISKWSDFTNSSVNLPLRGNKIKMLWLCVSGGEEWISTGLYLSPGMKTYISLPEEIVNKDWKVQCTMSNLNIWFIEFK